MGKLFPLMYDRAMAPLERKSFRKLRKKLIAEAEGNILEIGSGTGLNLPLYRFTAQMHGSRLLNRIQQWQKGQDSG